MGKRVASMILKRKKWNEVALAVFIGKVKVKRAALIYFGSNSQALTKPKPELYRGVEGVFLGKNFPEKAPLLVSFSILEKSMKKVYDER